MRRPDVAPQSYFGLDAIGARMGVSKSTILAWHRRFLFPLYIRRVGPRRVWYTHEGLIERWEIERCQEEHERRYGPDPRPAPPPDPIARVRTARRATGADPPPAAIVPASRGPTDEVLDALHALSRHVSRFALLANGHAPAEGEAAHRGQSTAAAVLPVP